MKKIIYTLAFVLIVQFTLTIDNCMSQWQADVRLTNEPALSSTTQNTNARCIASSGDTVHVVWYDNRDGASPEIYYKRSIDGGVNWGADTRITNNIYFSSNPSVSVSGSVVHIVWQENRDGNYEIYYRRSTDGGTSWGTDTRLTNDSSPSRYPCVAVSGMFVYVVWHDWNTLDIFYKRSTDGGISWAADTNLTNDVAASWYPSVSASGSFVHVVWMDGNGVFWDIKYKRSSNGGISWGLDIPLSNNSIYSSEYPSLAVKGLNLHVVWKDSRDGSNYEIYYKQSTDAGISWGVDTRLSNNPNISRDATISVSGSNVHVVWDDNRISTTNYEIFYIGSTNGGLNWGPETRLTSDSSISMFPYVSASGTAIHIVWDDYRNGNYEIYYKRNPTGNPIGIINISSGIPSSFSLSQNYPNPFNPTTVIRFSLSGVSNASLKIYDVTGREVETLVNEKLQPGTYEASFDGSRLTSGVYFYKLETNGFRDVKKMMLIK